jgi:hypothetical protein
MNYTITKNNKTLAFVLMAVGLIALVYGFVTDVHRTWASLLMNNFYVMAIALAGTFFIAFNTVAQASWAVVLRRVPEAMGTYILPAGVFMLLIFAFGHHDLYHWTHAELYKKGSEHFDPILYGKQWYLNIPFFVVRMIAYFAVWVIFTRILRKESLLQDTDGDLKHYKKSFRMGAAFLVLFGISSSMSAWDFIMSIDSHWFSTLFGWYVFIGLFVTGLTVMAMLVVYLKSQGYLEYVNDSHIHDLGKYMFAFSIFWSYLWFAQFMLIWYANLPEEVTYYIARQDHYRCLFLANVAINFTVPFLLFMTRDAKRKKAMLLIGGTIMLIGHWIDVYLMVTPGVMGSHGHIGFIEVGMLAGFAGVFLFMVFNAMSKAPMTPLKHPMLEESKHFEL